jgi:hypothetical protein
LTRLDWNLPPEPEAAPGAEAGGEPPEPTPGTWRPAVSAVLVYAAALVCAGFLGFRLGRLSVAREDVIRGVETALALEGIAWRDADLDLYLSTLDPEAPKGWLDGEARRFAAHAPQSYQGVLQKHTVLPGGRVEVLIREVAGPDPGPGFTAVRVYRLAGDAWVRTGD